MEGAEEHEKHTELIKVSEERYKYINTTYQRVSAKMYDYNCDIKLRVEKQTFRAHRDVLSEASDYFSAMFGHNMLEKDQGEIELHGISPRGFTMMMEYFYHGHITVDSDNIEDVIEAARFFHIEWLLYICCNFLIQHLSIINYDMVLHLADKYCLGELRGEIFKLVCCNFMTLADRPSFLKLSYDLLYQLLSEDHYIEATEGFIVKVVLKWLAYKQEDREQYQLVLLNLIRYPLLAMEELENLPSLCQDDPDLTTCIDQAVAYQVEPCKQCLLTSDDTEVRGSKTSLVLISALDDATQIHYRIPELQTVLSEETDTSFLDSVFEFASVAVLGNFMFVAGGYCRRSWCSSPAFYRYDPRNRSWAQLSSMNRPRVSFCLVASKRGLYAVAGIEHIVEHGIDQELILNSVEFYNPNENIWCYVPPLPFGCFSVAAAVLDDKVYITGGISEDPEDTVPVNYLHVYHPDDKAWHPRSRMFTDRQGHAMVSHNNKLYVFGGYTAAGQDMMSFANCMQNEMYDIDTDQWTQLRDTPAEFGRLSPSTAVMDGTIFLLSGANDHRFLHTFDAETEDMSDGEECGAYVQKLVVLNIAVPIHSLV